MTRPNLGAPRCVAMVAALLSLALDACALRTSPDPFAESGQAPDLTVFAANQSQRALSFYVLRNGHPFLLGRVEALQTQRFVVGWIQYSEHDEMRVMATAQKTGEEEWTSPSLVLAPGRQVLVTIEERVALSYVNVREE